MNERNINIRFVQDSDFSDWLALWEAYNIFYKRTVAIGVTQTTWARFLDPSEPVFGLVATDGDRIIGMATYLFHRNTSLISDICYLQDLFTLPELRGSGVGRLLVEAVTDRARKAGCPRIYGQTHETNSTAMKLYDQIAVKTGFLVYRKDC